MRTGYVPWHRPPDVDDRACTRDGQVELTYAEVDHRVDAVAEQFTAAGIGAGDVVAVMLPNQVELLLGLPAAWPLGAAATPVDPVFTPNEVGSQIQDSGTKLLVTASADANYGMAVPAADELSASPLGTLPPPKAGNDDLTLMIHTSGSTGRPKGVRLDHANLVAMGASIGEAMKLTGDDAPRPAARAIRT